MKYIFLFLCFIITFQNSNCENITLINSDKSEYSSKEIKCTGNVIIVFYKKIINANEVVYNKEKETLSAKGNIIVKDENENTYFLDSLFVTKDFKYGTAQNIKIIMKDKSRLAGESCHIKNDVYHIKKAVYTPCYICRLNNALTWQIKTKSITFNPKEYTECEDAKLEFFDVPIMYLPYFSYVSSNIKRKSGLLPPKISTSSSSGFAIMPQFLWAINESQELILKPIITTKMGSVAGLSYGLRFPNGEFNIDTSITGIESIKNQKATNPKEQKEIDKIQNSSYRGHFFMKTLYEINNIWRFNSNIKLASDRFYLKKFPFLEKTNRLLESNAKIEGFDEQNYTQIKLAFFQGENAESIPKILPIIERSITTNFLDGTCSFDSALTHLEFHNGRSSSKIASNLSWEKKLKLSHGAFLDYKINSIIKAIKVSEKETTNYNSSVDIAPQSTATLTLPLLINANITNFVATPMVSIIIAKNKKNKDIFEDFLCEINDTNIFEGNRTMSSYNSDSGRRLIFGSKIVGYHNNNVLFRGFLAKTKELSNSNQQEIMETTTNVKKKNSNIIHSVEFPISNELTIGTKGNYSSSLNYLENIETYLDYKEDVFEFNCTKFKGRQFCYNPFSTNKEKKSEQQKYNGLAFSTKLSLSSTTRLQFGVTLGNDMISQNTPSNKRKNYKLMNHYYGINYKNECTEIQFKIERKNYDVGDLKPETSLSLVVHMKNLGI